MEESKAKEPSNLPGVEKLLLEVPLYKVFHLSEADADGISNLISFQGSIDIYCVECEQHSIFWGQGEQPEIYKLGTYMLMTRSAHLLRGRYFYVVLVCSRVKDHHLLFYFHINDRGLIKVGQFPSLADIHLKAIEKYRQTLGNESYKEFARAVGLYAHGVGIGSFVYLRRIFENLVTESHNKASKGGDWDEDKFQRARMDEKLLMLKDYLPQTLVSNAAIYSILSRGIHSLSEDECLNYFNTTKLGIELILDEKIEGEERKEKEKTIANEVSRIKGDLS